jgi:sirohydrochlorin cobaltochelatase
MSSGLLLFAHGARDPRWANPFEAILQQVQASCPQLRVRLCFLELMEPSLPQAAADLAAGGCTAIRVQPLFLGTGGHLRRDLPALLDQLRSEHPGITWTMEAAIGEHPDVIDAMARAAVQSLG